MVPFCEDKLLLKHYLCHLYRLLSAYCSEFWDFCEELTPSAVRLQTFCSAMALRNSLFWCSTGVLPTVLPNHLKIMVLILLKVATCSAHVQVEVLHFLWRYLKFAQRHTVALPKFAT
jgi:hypothetical protein